MNKLTMIYKNEVIYDADVINGKETIDGILEAIIKHADGLIIELSDTKQMILPMAVFKESIFIVDLEE